MKRIWVAMCILSDQFKPRTGRIRVESIDGWINIYDMSEFRIGDVVEINGVRSKIKDRKMET